MPSGKDVVLLPCRRDRKGASIRIVADEILTLFERERDPFDGPKHVDDLQLARDGLVERQPHPTDGPQVLIVLTDTGVPPWSVSTHLKCGRFRMRPISVHQEK